MTPPTSLTDHLGKLDLALRWVLRETIIYLG